MHRLLPAPHDLQNTMLRIACRHILATTGKSLFILTCHPPLTHQHPLTPKGAAAPDGVLSVLDAHQAQALSQLSWPHCPWQVLLVGQYQ